MWLSNNKLLQMQLETIERSSQFEINSRSFNIAKVTLRDVSEPHFPKQPPAPISAPPSICGATCIDETPAFTPNRSLPPDVLQRQIGEACQAWLTKSLSMETRSGYSRELLQFLRFAGIADGAWERLVEIRPSHVAAWRDRLTSLGQSNAGIGRKLSVLRSLFSYLRVYGYTGPNPADTKFVAAPATPRDGKTVGLTPEDCRRILDAPSTENPEGIRDRALFAVLAFTGCRVGELCRLRMMDYKESGGYRVLEVLGKGGKERRVPLHPEAFERIDRWLAFLSDAEMTDPLFRPVQTARGKGFDGFRVTALTRRAAQFLVARYVRKLALDPNVTVHSFRVTALTTARERGADLVDLQDFAGHANPQTTLTYIRNRDRLSNSPAFVLKY